MHGHITNVGTVASESSENEKEKGGGGGGNPGSGSGENATISVTLALDHPVAHLDKAPVSVELVKSIRHDVLAVPATALVATAGGGYAVQALEGCSPRELAVTPGMFANGYVEIEGAGHPRRADGDRAAMSASGRCSSCATWSSAIRAACRRCAG